MSDEAQPAGCSYLPEGSGGRPGKDMSLGRFNPNLYPIKAVPPQADYDKGVYQAR